MSGATSALACPLTEILSRSAANEPLQNTVNIIFKKVYVRVADLVALGIHRQTAAVYLDQFVDQGLLSKARVGRDNIYKNIKLLELFDYDSEETK